MFQHGCAHKPNSRESVLNQHVAGLGLEADLNPMLLLLHLTQTVTQFCHL